MRYLVTGANRGIGLEFTKTLLQRGDEVLATARQPDAAEELQALGKEYGERLTLRALDVTDPKSVAALSEALEGRALDVAIHNAGTMGQRRPLGELDYDEIRRTIEVNAIGALRAAEATVPAVLRGDRKVLVGITSKMGSIGDNGSGGSYAYRMSKAALNMAWRSIAVDLRDRGVSAFVMHPGWVRTRMGGENALITTEQSVEGMLKIIDGADADTAGKFWEWKGIEVPW